MTSRERVLAALNRRPVDRVPIMEMGIDWKVMRGLGFSGYLQMIKALDLDGVSVNQVLYLLGLRGLALRHIPHYTDEWGVKHRLTGELLPIPVRHPVPTPERLPGFKPPRPEKSPLLGAIRYVRRRVPDRAVTMLCRADFAASWFLCGMDVLLMSYIEDPHFADRLAEMASDYYTRLIGLCIQAGVDVVFLSDDYAYKTGTLMSRAHFQRFVLPWLTRAVTAVHDAGGLAVKHTDGNISGIIDLLVDTGVDGLGPLEPEAGNDLVELQKTWGNRVALVGNIDVDLLCRGTSDEVAATTTALVRSLALRGGHVLSSGNTITSSVKPENFRAMVEAGRSAMPHPQAS